MIKNLKIALIIIGTVITFSSCEKNGELIEAGTYGNLSVKISTPSAEKALLIHADGRTDTLKTDGSNLVLPARDHQIKITDFDGKTILDTTLKIQRSKTFLLEGIYTGSTILLDDGDQSVQPAAGNSMVRFVIKEPSLPNVLDLKFVLFYSSGGNQYRITTLEAKGVNKSKFSSYIEFEDPRKLFTDIPDAVTAFRYYIEAYDPNDNNKKVMDITTRSHCAIKFTMNEALPVFAPGYITSMAIGAPNTLGVYQAEVIFERPAK